MQEFDKIELTPIQATAYWWTNRIKNRVREILVKSLKGENTKEFAELFSNYTEQDWRHLYLELTKCIANDINNFVPEEETAGIDYFKQDTCKGGHDIINLELSKIINKNIPDISLANNDTKDMAIYTNMNGACIWYKSYGINDLSTSYKPNYILTGNDKELNFYNLLMATIVILKKYDDNFKYTFILKERFCSLYMNLSNDEESISKYYTYFNRSFDKANEMGCIIGSYNEEIYYTTFHDFDLIELKPYMEQAKNYANIIFQNVKNNDLSLKRTLK